jgi:hypothetical protein
MFDISVNLEDNARLLWEALAIGRANVIDSETLAELADDRLARGTMARTLGYFANLEAGDSEQQFIETRR